MAPLGNPDGPVGTSRRSHKSTLEAPGQTEMIWDDNSDAHPEAEPIQIVFDFTIDLAGSEAADDNAA